MQNWCEWGVQKLLVQHIFPHGVSVMPLETQDISECYSNKHKYEVSYDIENKCAKPKGIQYK